MPRTIQLPTPNRTFLLRALSQNLRLDSRPFTSLRPLTLSFPSPSTSLTTLGHTRVLVTISSEIVAPDASRPFDGLFTITCELSPLAGAQYESGSGRQGIDEVVLQRLLEKAIRRSRAVDTESLCILAGKKCWSIRADVHVLDGDGGVLDAACFGTMAALMNFRREEVEVKGEEVRVFSRRERVGVGLSVLHVPLCVTFSFYQLDDFNGDGDGKGSGEMVTLVDANTGEEMCRDAEVVVTCNDFEAVQVAKLGGKAVDARLLSGCFGEALRHAREMGKLIREKLEQERKNINGAGGLGVESRGMQDRPIG